MNRQLKSVKFLLLGIFILNVSLYEFVYLVSVLTTATVLAIGALCRVLDCFLSLLLLLILM